TFLCSSRRRHTSTKRDWSSDVCSSDLVSPASVHTHIIGEHGDTEFPLWSAARIGSVPILDWQQDGKPLFTQDELDELAVDVRDAAYKVIQGKGATNYAIGLS